MDTFEIEAQQRLDTVQRELEQLRRQREGVSAKIERLEKVSAGLEFLLDSNGSSPKTTKNADDEMGFMSRKDAVAKVLQDAPGPLSTKAILKELQDAGRGGDTLNGVSGALSRLKADRLARPFGRRGYWMWAPKNEQPAASSPDGESPPPSGDRSQGVAVSPPFDP